MNLGKTYQIFVWPLFIVIALSLTGCGGGSGAASPEQPPPPEAKPLDTWTVSLPDLRFSAFSKIAWGSGLYVVIGNNGNVATSTDQISWTIRKAQTTGSFMSIIFGNGTFAAVGERGIIFTSSDGISWTARNSGVTDDLTKIIYANNMFVALGTTGLILTSQDAITWAVNSGIPSPLHGITYGKGIIVAVGDNGLIITSLDGKNWTARESGTSYDIRDVAYGNGMFIAVTGSVLTSSDGLIWTVEDTMTNVPEHIIFGNNVFLGTYPTLSGDVILKSNDGKSWLSYSLGLTIDDLFFNNGIFTAVLSEGSHAGLGDSWRYIVNSTDGANWTGRYLGRETYIPGSEFQSAAFLNNKFFAFGSPILSSQDAISWTFGSRTYSSDNSATATAIINGMAFGNETYVAVGDSGAIVSSSDGQAWMARNSGTLNSLKGVVFGNGIFIAVGEHGTVLTSSDGISWIAGSSGYSGTLFSAAYGKGIYVVTGDLGKVLTSADGIAWSPQASGSLLTLFKVIFGNELFVAVGTGINQNVIITSADGVSWGVKYTGTPTPCADVAFGNGLFVAFNDNVLSSSDGSNWVMHQFTPPNGDPKQTCGVTYGNGSFVAVWNSSIMQSGLVP